MRYLLIFILTVATFAGAKQKKAEYQRVRQLTPENIAMETIDDGTYRGSFMLANNFGDIQVEVVVKGHKLISIEIVEDNLPKKEKKAYQLSDIMVAKNSTDVDAISGATTTSVAIKSAVADALSKGVELPTDLE